MPSYMVDRATPEKLANLAIALGFVFGYKKETGEPIPAVGELLDFVADIGILLPINQRKS